MYNPFFRVSLQEQILFAKHLAVMIRAGMSILDGLRLLKKQTRSRSLKKIIDQLVADVSNGQFLSASLERFRGIFGDFAINIIRVGEAGGILHDNLNYLAQELEKRRELRRKVLSSLLYPIIIVILTITVTGLLTLYIFPKILPVFKSLNIALPITTRILIVVVEVLLRYGLYILGGAIVAIILFLILLRVPTFRLIAHQVLLYLPLFGRISRNYNTSNFCRTLGLLLKSDVKVVEAVAITADTLGNLVFRAELKHISVQIAKGEEIAPHLEAKSHLFPPMVAQMVALGEQTGNLSETLIYLSEFYEKEVDETTKNLSTVLEPLLMVTMGAVVGFVAISIITPIYEVTQSLRPR